MKTRKQLIEQNMQRAATAARIAGHLEMFNAGSIAIDSIVPHGDGHVVLFTHTWSDMNNRPHTNHCVAITTARTAGSTIFSDR